MTAKENFCSVSTVDVAFVCGWPHQGDKVPSKCKFFIRARPWNLNVCKWFQGRTRPNSCCCEEAQDEAIIVMKIGDI